MKKPLSFHGAPNRRGKKAMKMWIRQGYRKMMVSDNFRRAMTDLAVYGTAIYLTDKEPSDAH